MGYIETSDSQLDDPLWRRDIIEEERRTWEDEMADEADSFSDDDEVDDQ